MKISDLFRFSTDNLRRRKGRTALTVIGVVVGVCAIVVMVSLGIAVRDATDSMLQGFADLTKITVYNSGSQRDTPALDDKMLRQLKSLDHVVAATPLYRMNFNATIYGGKNKRYQGETQNVGIDPEAAEPLGYKLVWGSYLSGQSLGRDKIPVLVEQQAVYRFADTKKNYMNPDRYISPEYEGGNTDVPTNLPAFDENGNLLNADAFFFNPTANYTLVITYGSDPETGEEKTKEYELVPVGIFDSKDDKEMSGSIVMSIDDMKKLENEYNKLTRQGGGSLGMQNQNETKGYENVIVKVDNVNNTAEVEQAIKDIGYQIYSLSEFRNQLQGQVMQTQMMLGGLAAVSLFVAALNIANTMTMAIYERTKEIGVMKVLGCRLRDIRTMFLIESGTIGLIGGIIGSVVSFLISMVLNYLPQMLLFLGIDSNINIAGMFGFGDMMQNTPGVKLSVIPLWLILLALGFATGVGLLSGIAPANRAVKISSLEAIRHE